MSLSLVGIAGSLRRASYNRGLVRAARELVPDGVTMEVFEVGGLPHYNADLEADVPPAARNLRERVRAADGILFATPEYNYSVPGVLKNAIDWGSQPRGQNVWGGKASAIVGASNSVVGTARAQLHLRQSLVALNMRVWNPELLIGGAPGKFDAEGNLTDAETRAALREYLAGWIASL